MKAPEGPELGLFVVIWGRVGYMGGGSIGLSESPWFARGFLRTNICISAILDQWFLHQVSTLRSHEEPRKPHSTKFYGLQNVRMLLTGHATAVLKTGPRTPNRSATTPKTTTGPRNVLDCYQNCCMKLSSLVHVAGSFTLALHVNNTYFGA